MLQHLRRAGHYGSSTYVAWGTIILIAAALATISVAF